LRQGLRPTAAVVALCVLSVAMFYDRRGSRPVDVAAVIALLSQ